MTPDTSQEAAVISDLTEYKFETHEGWPPNGEPGFFFGFDAACNPAILHWREGAWHGVRWQLNQQAIARYNTMPEAFRRGEGTGDYVVRWAFAPHVYDIPGG